MLNSSCDKPVAEASNGFDKPGRRCGIAECFPKVSDVNVALQAVADLNKQIRSINVSGCDATGLIDERQKAIDSISAIIPVKEVPFRKPTHESFQNHSSPCYKEGQQK